MEEKIKCSQGKEENDAEAKQVKIETDNLAREMLGSIDNFIKVHRNLIQTIKKKVGAVKPALGVRKKIGKFWLQGSQLVATDCACDLQTCMTAFWENKS